MTDSRFCPICGGTHAPFLVERTFKETIDRLTHTLIRSGEPRVTLAAESNTLGNCAVCGFFRHLITEADGTLVCGDCFPERNGYRSSEVLSV